MEVKPGYLQTDVGVTPEDWDIVPLGDIIDYVKGYAFQPVDYRPCGVRIIRVSDTTFDSVRNDNEIFIDSDKAKSYVRRALKKNDLVLSTVGSKPPMYDSIVGRVVIIDSGTEGALLNQNAVLLRSKDKKSVTQTLLLNHFKTKRYSQFIESIFRGNANQASITLKDLFKFKLAIPKKTQEISSIATALSDADARISSLEQVIAKKRDIKQAAMQDLLIGKQRLPGFDFNKKCKQSEVGRIPEDWEVKRLGDLFEITSSKRVFQSEWKRAGIPFYRARELAVLSENGFVYNELFITEEMYDAFKRTYGVPTIGDMLVTGVGTLGKAYVVTGDHEFYFKDGNIIWFKISGNVMPEFLRQLFLTPLIAKQISDGSAGTTVGTYTISGAQKTLIPYPSLPEQRAIATVLSDMDAELAALEQKRDKTKAIKQGMMQELLTGRIRLT